MAKKKAEKLIDIEEIMGEKDLAKIKKAAKRRGFRLSIKRSGKEGRFNIYIVRVYEKGGVAEKKQVFSGKYHVVADDQQEAERKANKIDKAQGSLYLGRLKRSTAISLTRTKPVRITPKVGRLR